MWTLPKSADKMADNRLQMVVVLGAISLLLIPITSAALDQTPANRVETVENESVEMDVGNWVQLNETDGHIYYDNETVYNSSGVELVEGTDYDYETSNQSIYWYNTNNTTNGVNGSATYSIGYQPSTLRSSVSIVGNVAVLVAALSMVLLAVFAVASLDAFDTGGGRV